MINHYASPLLIPISIGSLKLKNRFVALPMACSHGDNGGISHQSLAYYQAKAQGGFALIIREGEDLALADPLYCDEYQLPSHQKLVSRVHQYGAKIVAQTGLPGRQAPMPSSAPSSIADPIVDIIPHELSLIEIENIIHRYGKKAHYYQRAGYDGLEIHGAHGYQISQFMSSYANKRFDDYGGSLANRMRFPLAIIAEIRKYCGPDFTLLFKLSADEFVPGGRAIEESKAIAIMLEKASIDCLDISAAVYGSLEYFISPMNMAPALLAQYAAQIKKVVNIPVLTGNRIKHPHIAESLILSGETDLIGMARASLADPALPNKFFSGHLDEIRYCIGCNQGCLQNLFGGQPVTCMVNPTAGYEYLDEVAHARRQQTANKQVHIIGGGPAGLYAAISAAEIGHHVTLFEQNAQLGGNFALAAIPPEKGEMAEMLSWQIRKIKQLHVKIKLNYTYSVASFEQLKPDTVIVASGSIPIIPKLSGINLPHVYLAQDILAGRAIAGDRTVVIGGGLIGVETALHLTSQRLMNFNNRQVQLVEMKDQIASDEEYTRRKLLLRSLEKEKIVVYTRTRLLHITEQSVVVVSHKGEFEIRCNCVVLAMGVQSNNQLYHALKDRIPSQLIGDAQTISNAVNAVRDGFCAGLKS